MLKMVEAKYMEMDRLDDPGRLGVEAQSSAVASSSRSNRPIIGRDPARIEDLDQQQTDEAKAPYIETLVEIQFACSIQSQEHRDRYHEQLASDDCDSQ